MEANGLPNAMFNNIASSGMLGLEISLNHPQHHNPPQNPVKLGHPIGSKPKVSAISDDDEPNYDEGGEGKRKGSPWQRMKWTDSMVRLLIMVVFYVGDEAGPDVPDQSGKKKLPGSGAGAGALQKKGKWKSVSRAMLERGFFVSPQQCEDKFNDLNKRYKRVNDILGKGTACRVVENQTLLDQMDHLSPKMKEEVKKLLNSKHLFFREMCAYHNSCAGSSRTAGGAQPSPETQTDPPQSHQHHHFHPNGRAALDSVSRMAKESSTGGEEEEDYESEDEEDDEDENEEDEENESEGNKGTPRKRAKRDRALFQRFKSELKTVLEDPNKSLWEKRQWMKARLLQLEEERVGHEGQGIELEKQRLKWLRFSSKKEREMEEERLRNERVKLENDRMVLLLKQKELELMDLQQQYSSSIRRSDPSSTTG